MLKVKNIKSNTNHAIFIFAHQDDETGCFSVIEKKIFLGYEVIIIYLTSGTSNGSKSFLRNYESLNALSLIGVKKKNIIFIGNTIYSPDGRLAENLNKVYREISKILFEIYFLDSLYVIAWEGGHQDHDAAHLIGLALAKKFNILNNSFQFPLYTGARSQGSFFRLFKPIRANGNPIYSKITLRNRIKYLKLCLAYPSQYSSWIGLFPFFLFHYCVFGTQILQPLSLARIKSRPHKGKLFYERRFSYKYNTFKKNTSNFIEKFLI